MQRRLARNTGATAIAVIALAWAGISAGTQTPATGSRTITEADCSAERLGASIPTTAIGEPVSGVTLSAPRWVAASGTADAYCVIDGAMAPVDTSATAKPINFRVVLPATWSRRAVHLGGGGNNGVIPNLTGGPGGPGSSWGALGAATFGSDSGHQNPPGRATGPAASDWSTNDEAIKNLGYMQMKKTHDAAIVLITRMYGDRPRYTYYIGTSQGGREALTVAQRYPADYDGVAANVPIVNFSSLMLAPELIRIQEKPAANWVTRAKVNAIRGEFMRQCDALDGLTDGVINNYLACRAIFDTSQGSANRHPWMSKRCPNNVDPNPANTAADACLTDGQIATLEFVYRPYRFSAPLANNVRSFGMWVPNTDPSGSGLIADVRFKGQEGATETSPMHSHLGVLGVTGFLMGDPAANPLDYVEGGKFAARRGQLSQWLDSTNPDLSAFARRGGRLLVNIGTNDTLASPGAQLDYYQSVITTMGRARVDEFARFYVTPQTGHGLSGTIYTTDGEGKAVTPAPIPNTFDRVAVLMDWVEKQSVPSKTLTVTAGDRSMPLCSYPAYPRYTQGPATMSTSYACAEK